MWFFQYTIVLYIPIKNIIHIADVTRCYQLVLVLIDYKTFICISIPTAFTKSIILYCATDLQKLLILFTNFSHCTTPNIIISWKSSWQYAIVNLLINKKKKDLHKMVYQWQSKFCFLIIFFSGIYCRKYFEDISKFLESKLFF